MASSWVYPDLDGDGLHGCADYLVSSVRERGAEPDENSSVHRARLSCRALCYRAGRWRCLEFQIRTLPCRCRACACWGVGIRLTAYAYVVGYQQELWRANFV